MVRGNGTHVFYSLSGDALADLKSYLAERACTEADVAAHHERVLAFEQIERANVGMEQLHQATRRFVEQRRERHRPRGEFHEIEHAVETRVCLDHAIWADGC